MPASGLTLYHLYTSAAVGQVLHAVQQQQGLLALYAQELQEAQQAPEIQDPQENQASTADAAPLAAHAAPIGWARVSDVDGQAQRLTLTLAAAPTGPWPAHALGVVHLAGGVRVQWRVAGAWQPTPSGQWQLQMDWPTQLLQLQRRRHPRLSVPLGHHYSASFKWGHRRCELDMDDLSLGGLALRGTRQETAMLFLGRQLPQVVVSMADGTALTVALTVRSRRSYPSFLLGEQVVVGCSVEAISAEDAALLEGWLAAGMQPVHA